VPTKREHEAYDPSPNKRLKGEGEGEQDNQSKAPSPTNNGIGPDSGTGDAAGPAPAINGQADAQTADQPAGSAKMSTAIVPASMSSLNPNAGDFSSVTRLSDSTGALIKTNPSKDLLEDKLLEILEQLEVFIAKDKAENANNLRLYERKLMLKQELDKVDTQIRTGAFNELKHAKERADAIGARKLCEFAIENIDHLSGIEGSHATELTTMRTAMHTAQQTFTHKEAALQDELRTMSQLQLEFAAAQTRVADLLRSQ